MKPNTTSLITLPPQVDTAILAKHQKSGDPVVCVKLIGVGNNAPYQFRGNDNRSYIFRWDTKREGHILLVPLSLWMQGKGRDAARMAHDIMNVRRMPHPMIVTMEMPIAAIIPQSPEMGAADTAPAENVVGLGDEATAAPAVEAFPATKVEDWPAPIAEQVVGPPSLYDLAYDLTEAPKRIKALAALLRVEESALREAVESPSSKVELAAAGWVRRKGGES